MEQLFYYTEDIVSILRDKLNEIGAKRVFLVRGTNSYIFCGAADVMKRVSETRGLHVTEFCDFSVNPKDEEARKGVELLLEDKPDVIIAIGGGSVMDMAKLIRHYATEQHYKIPLWAIPSTAGTGAEATHFAVVYKNGVKHSLAADDILPDIAILYPPFTYGNNTYLTACTGFDALAQAIEAFWNPNATDESDTFASDAIKLIHKNLPLCLENPFEHSYRDDLLRGAYFAGRAINITKTTAPHAFSYAFTTHCGYPHGHAVAITFPFFAELNMKNNPKREELCQLLGLDKDVDLMLYFVEYVNRIGLRYRGTCGKDLHELLGQVNLERLKNNPIHITDDVIGDLRLYILNHKGTII